MKKTALITGLSGQDGSYLAKLLLEKNYKIVGCDRRSSRNDNWRLRYLGIEDQIIKEDIDITEINNIIRIFAKYNINEVYNLAAQSFVHTSFENPIVTSMSTALGPLNILEVLRNSKKNIKFYQASSSEMYGGVKEARLNENSKFDPQSPYAISKLFAYHTTKNYRKSYNMFAVNGILFNHESPLRGEEFVTKKITSGLVKVLNKKLKVLEVGNLYAKRDWGYAGDYVEAMWKMLQQKKPQDYVISTGKTYNIKFFIDLCVKYLKVNTKWVGKGLNEKLINLSNNQCLIKINKKYFRPAEVNYLKGDCSKAQKELNWKPKVLIKDLVKKMIDYDIQKYS